MVQERFKDGKDTLNGAYWMTTGLDSTRSHDFKKTKIFPCLQGRLKALRLQPANNVLRDMSLKKVRRVFKIYSFSCQYPIHPLSPSQVVTKKCY